MRSQGIVGFGNTQKRGLQPSIGIYSALAFLLILYALWVVKAEGYLEVVGVLRRNGERNLCRASVWLRGGRIWGC